MSFGFLLALFALSIGMIFFLYSIKYYITLAIVLIFSRKSLAQEKELETPVSHEAQGLVYNLFHAATLREDLGQTAPPGELPPEVFGRELSEKPFISIHIPLYNEKRVASRILAACTNLDYPNYEVVVVDDSIDETTQIVKRWAEHPRVKIVHRDRREGFKGGALQKALEMTDPAAEFVVIFDADFIPYPDTLEQFVKYFRTLTAGRDYHQSKIAAIQGYQWHVLNKNENWITRGVRTEFSGSYVVERPGTEIVGSMRLIAGSVYMIRADLLRTYGWSKSITEDFELTLRLYQDGYKVVFTPYIQAPSECPSTLRRLIRQRMRWAEGHTHNVKRYFWKILRSPFLARREKLEFLYLAPYYLQAAFFLTGTLAWFVSDAILNTPLPFWTELWGWSLVFTNLLALPLMNGTGLFLEESDRRDYLGIFSFILLSFILVPFQAYAAIKGLFEKEEGHWFRTPKSGKITDTFFRNRFARWLAVLFPGRAQTITTPAYLQSVTANNRFNHFGIQRQSVFWLPKLILVIFLSLTIALVVFTSRVPSVKATNPTDPFELTNDASAVQSLAWQMVTTAAGPTDTTMQWRCNTDLRWTQWRPGAGNRAAICDRTTAPTFANGYTPNGYGFILEGTTFGSDGNIGAGVWNVSYRTTNANTTGIVYLFVSVWRIDPNSAAAPDSATEFFNWTGSTNDLACDCTIDTTESMGSQAQFNFTATENRLYVEFWGYIQTGQGSPASNNISFAVDTDPTAPDPYIDVPSVQVPEQILFLIFIIPFLPKLIKRLRRTRLASAQAGDFTAKPIFILNKRIKFLWPPPRGPGG